MSKTNNRSKNFFLTLMCLSSLLYNGCTFTVPKLSKSSRDNTEEEKADTYESSVMNEELKIDETDAKQVMPFTVTKRPENNPFNISGKEYLSEASSISVEKVPDESELKVLKKVTKLEAKLKEEEKQRKKTDILLKELNKKIAALQPESVTIRPGGYLADGSTIGLGIVDGDDELRVLKKVKRLEARLVEEEKKVEALTKELADLQTAKEAVENDFANTVKSMEEKSKGLLEKASAMESTAKKAEARAIAAEKALNPIKKELIKLQIADTKVQQELYKLKIEKLKRDEE
jgi:hypothetical protein